MRKKIIKTSTIALLTLIIAAGYFLTGSDDVPNVVISEESGYYLAGMTAGTEYSEIIVITETTKETIPAETEVLYVSESEEDSSMSDISDLPDASETEESETEDTCSFTVEEAFGTVYVYNTGSLNVRSGPGTEYSVLGILSYGESVSFTGICDNGWYQVEYNSQTGYASGKYLTDKEPESESESESENAISSSTYPLIYSDSTATITITKEKYAGNWCYIAHLVFTDYTRFGTACANGKYGGGYETTSHAASRLGAIFCVNGCYSAPSLDYGVVRSSIVCNDKACYVPGVYSSLTGIFSSPESIGVSGMLLSNLAADRTVTDTFCFGGAGLVNGEVVANSDTSRAQRTFMGTNGNPGDIYIVVSEGRYKDGVSAGLTYSEMAKLLQEKGCTFEIPLDGGGSSAMYFDGEILNSAASNERAVVDFVYLK